MSDSKQTFEVNGKEYFVKKPTAKDQLHAEIVYQKAWKEAFDNNLYTDETLEAALESNGYWNRDMEIEFQTLRQEIIDAEFRIKKGGFRLNEAKDLAFAVKQKRIRMLELLNSRNALNNKTCEGFAVNERFKALVACCTFNKDGSRVYGSYDAYLESEDSEVAESAARELYKLSSKTSQEINNEDLFEDKFLKTYKFMDSEGRLIDKDGRFVDAEGRHINEEGKFIKWISETDFIYVDSEGRELTEDSEFVVEFSPFLDDDGNEVSLEEEKPKKKGRPKKTQEEATEEISP